MSRYVTPAPNTLTIHIQSADPDDMTARVGAAMDTIATDPANRVTSMRLSGAGDGHSFVLSVEYSPTAGGLVPGQVKSGIGFFMASDAPSLDNARSLLAARLALANPTFELHDSEIAGASKGLRFMGMLVFTNPASGPSETGCPPLSRELWADVGTTAPLAQRDGSICAPFGTATAALTQAAALPAGPVTVNLAAGTYVEAIVLPPRDGLAIRGSGESQTRIVAPAGAAPAVSWAPTAVQGAGIHTFAMSDVTVEAPGVGQRCIDFVSSTVAPNTMLDQGATFERVNCVAPATAQACRFTRIGQIIAIDSNLSRDDVSLAWLNCSAVTIRRSNIGAMTVTWDFADAGGVPGLGRQLFLLDDSTDVQQGVILTGQPEFLAEPTCRLFAQGASPYGVRGVGLSTDAGTGTAPIIALHCQCADVLLPYPDLTGFPGAAGCATDRGNFLGSVDISTPVGSAVDLNVEGRFAKYRGAVVAGRHTNIDIKGSDYDQANLSAPGVDGSIDREHHILLGFVFAMGDPPIPITPRLPPGVTAYSVGFTQADTFGLIGTYGYDTKAPDGFTAHKVGAFNGTAVDVRVTRVP